MTEKVFLYDFTTQFFYAGLGVPFKITRDVQFALKVDDDTMTTQILIKQLNKHYDADFKLVTTPDVIPKADYICDNCNSRWSEAEKQMAELGVKNENYGDLYDALPIGSKFKMGNYETMTRFSNQILNATHCKCRRFCCGNCSPKKRGRSANKCEGCKGGR